jgi:hypothetical protein
MSEEPEQDRRRRHLLWLLLFFAGITSAAAFGVGIGTLVFHGTLQPPRHQLTASGIGFASDRDGSGSGARSHASTSPSPTRAGSPSTTTSMSTSTSTSVEPRGTTRVTTAGGGYVGRLTVSMVVEGQLSPGRPRSLVLTVGNPGAHAVRVTALDVTVEQPAATGCLPRWFTTAGNPSSHLVIRAGRTGQVTLQLLLRNLPHRNQDACKAVHIPLKVHVAAVEVPL